MPTEENSHVSSNRSQVMLLQSLQVQSVHVRKQGHATLRFRLQLRTRLRMRDEDGEE